MLQPLRVGSFLRRNHHNHYWSIQHQKANLFFFGDQPLIQNVFPGVNPENLMVPGPTRLRNIHGSQINFEPDILVTFSAPLLPLMMSYGLGWTTAPSSTIPDELTPILRFLHSSPASHSGADLQLSSASADCRFAELRRPWRQIGELIFAPRVSRGVHKWVH